MSPFSDPRTVRSLILYPSTPRGIQVSSSGPYTLTASWEEPVPSNGPVVFYEIQYQLFTGSQTPSKIEFLEVLADVLTANLTGLMPQSAYSVSIRAKNRDEQGNLLIGQFSQVTCALHKAVHSLLKRIIGNSWRHWLPSPLQSSYNNNTNCNLI